MAYKSTHVSPIKENITIKTLSKSQFQSWTTFLSLIFLPKFPKRILCLRSWQTFFSQMVNILGFVGHVVLGATTLNSCLLYTHYRQYISKWCGCVLQTFMNIEMWISYTFHISWNILLCFFQQFENVKTILSLQAIQYHIGWRVEWILRGVIVCQSLIYASASVLASLEIYSSLHCAPKICFLKYH